MARRGRPRYPGLLTPRETEVLALLRQGLSSPEIARGLGISRDGMKYHVSQILSKLGVESREQAASWREPSRRRWVWVSWGTATKAAGGVLIGSALIALVLLAVGTLTGDRVPASAPGPLLVGLTDEVNPGYFLGDVPAFEQEGVYYFVIEVATGRTLGVRDLCEHEASFAVPPGEVHCGIRRVTWLDNDTLRVETNVTSHPTPVGEIDQAVYEVDLDGVVRRTTEVPPGRNRTATPDPTTSRDGRWSFAEEEIPQGDSLFAREERRLVITGIAGREYAIASVKEGSASWSPGESKAAFIGNFCVDLPAETRYDLFTFAPEQERLVNLTAALPETYLYFRWHPSGGSIVATGVGRDTHKVRMFHVSGVGSRILLESNYGYFMPEEWSPDGRWLLLQFNGGGDWCLTGPPATPTSLQGR